MLESSLPTYPRPHGSKAPTGTINGEEETAWPQSGIVKEEH